MRALRLAVSPLFSLYISLYLPPSQVRELRLAAERSFRLHLATHLLSLSPAEGGGTQRTEARTPRAEATLQPGATPSATPRAGVPQPRG